MKKGIRVTSLSSIWTCAYKHKNSERDIKVADTYKGDIINAAATSDSPVDEILNYYIKNINTDLKLGMVLGECVEKVQSYIKEKKELNPFFAQERKFVLPYNDEYYIEGTPDIYYRDKEGFWHIEDIKMSTHSWFNHEDSWTYNLQTYIYPLFIMEYYDLQECTFSYVVYDKGTAKEKIIGPRTRTRKECWDIVHKAMDMYMEAEFTGERKPNVQRMCFFCPLKKLGCPAFNKESESQL